MSGASRKVGESSRGNNPGETCRSLPRQGLGPGVHPCRAFFFLEDPAV